MGIAGGDFKTVLQTLKRVGLLMETDACLPSVSGLIAGEVVRGSWWSHKAAQRIFLAMGQLEDHRDVIFTKLVSGKVTLVHRKLWSEVFAIGISYAPWQLKDLSKSARALFDKVNKQGSLRTDQLEWPKSEKTKPGDIARALERKILVHTEQFHTESGAHAKLLESWKIWAKRIDFKPEPISPEEAQRKIEEIVKRLNKQFKASGSLPWS